MIWGYIPLFLETPIYTWVHGSVYMGIPFLPKRRLGAWRAWHFRAWRAGATWPLSCEPTEPGSQELQREVLVVLLVLVVCRGLWEKVVVFCFFLGRLNEKLVFFVFFVLFFFCGGFGLEHFFKHTISVYIYIHIELIGAFWVITFWGTKTIKTGRGGFFLRWFYDSVRYAQIFYNCIILAGTYLGIKLYMVMMGIHSPIPCYLEDHPT